MELQNQTRIWRVNSRFFTLHALYKFHGLLFFFLLRDNCITLLSTKACPCDARNSILDISEVTCLKFMLNLQAKTNTPETNHLQMYKADLKRRAHFSERTDLYALWCIQTKNFEKFINTAYRKRNLLQKKKKTTQAVTFKFRKTSKHK